MATSTSAGDRTPCVIGVGMTRFTRIETEPWCYPKMAGAAVRDALADAGIGYDAVQRAAAGFVFAPSTAGQRVLYDIGLTGIPVVNVTNNCATGSTALALAVEWVAAGLADVVLAVGFEQMTRAAMAATPPEVPGRLAASTLDHHLEAMWSAHGIAETPLTAQFFANAALEHRQRYGTTDEQLAAVAVKNHGHSTANPNAQFTEAYTLEQVLADRPVHPPLTRSQCSPMSDGAAAAVVASARFAEAHGLTDRAVRVLGQSLVTDTRDTFAHGSMIDVVGSPMTEEAGRRALACAGIGIDEVDVMELHDCFTVNELITYEALGLCKPGESGPLVTDGATTYGGTWVVNPSGGLISKGHPLGATGLAQCAELTWQLRGDAEGRQVAGAEVGLAHNLGLGGACVVTVYGGPR
ncbi:beta-ketoacyl synthase N-terminal-like domain-containing protein [Nocardioides sp. YIM 152588]|uniref:thiolase C-terminal domain-containing protein n=1 Tax=Nocardioides sp. YIM 152588 TaxID=3158259 RepID=UPI0032E39F3E